MRKILALLAAVAFLLPAPAPALTLDDVQYTTEMWSSGDPFAFAFLSSLAGTVTNLQSQLCTGTVANATYATTAGYATNAGSATYATTAGLASNATTAVTVTGAQSNLIAGAVQSEVDPLWVAVSNTVTQGAALGATALQAIQAGNVVRVDTSGSDVTGARGDWSKPFAGLHAATAVLQPGDLLYIGAGNFTITNTISLPDRVTMRGSGAKATVLTNSYFSATSVVATFALGEGIVVEGLAIWSYPADQYTPQSSIFVAGTNCTFRRLFLRSGYDMWYGAAVGQMRVEDSDLFAQYDMFAMLDGGPLTNTVTRCRIGGDQTLGEGAPLLHSSSDDVKLLAVDCDVHASAGYDAGGGSTGGLYLYGCRLTGALGIRNGTPVHIDAATHYAASEAGAEIIVDTPTAFSYLAPTGSGAGLTGITAAQVGAVPTNAGSATALSLTLTNGTTFADGVLNGTNGLYFVPFESTNRYWILGGN